MKTVVETLRELYAKLGGTDYVDDVSTVAEMIEKVTEVAENGGGGGGGSSDFYVVNYNSATQRADHTAKEIYDAYTSGLIPIMKNGGIVFSFRQANGNSGGGYAQFIDVTSGLLNGVKYIEYHSYSLAQNSPNGATYVSISTTTINES